MLFRLGPRSNATLQGGGSDSGKGGDSFLYGSTTYKSGGGKSGGGGGGGGGGSAPLPDLDVGEDLAQIQSTNRMIVIHSYLSCFCPFRIAECLTYLCSLLTYFYFICFLFFDGTSGRRTRRH